MSKKPWILAGCIIGLLAGAGGVVYGAGASSGAPAPCVCSRPVGSSTVEVGPSRTELMSLNLFHCVCGELDCAYEPGSGVSCK